MEIIGLVFIIVSVLLIIFIPKQKTENTDNFAS
jgi:hypothetical protein